MKLKDFIEENKFGVFEITQRNIQHAPMSGRGLSIHLESEKDLLESKIILVDDEIFILKESVSGYAKGFLLTDKMKRRVIIKVLSYGKFL